MKKAIINRFLFVLVFALAVTGIISYLTASKRLLENTIQSMQKISQIIDYTLDYENNISTQINSMKTQILKSEERITVIRSDGIVVADSDYDDVSVLENHLQRAEVQSAIQTGKGYCVRYSESMKEQMLYTAMLSENKQYILRLAVKYTGAKDYFWSLIPAYVIGAACVLVLSMLISTRLSTNVTRPLKEIADEMSVLQGDIPQFHFNTYKYPELNRISNTTDRLTNEIKAYVEKVDFEKQIRQEFFSNASHELKTPITSIKGYAEILRNGFAKTEESKKDCISRIITESDHMTSLINDILMISKLETKEANVDISEIRLVPLLNDILDSVRPLADKNKISIQVDCMPITVEGSAKQYRELLMNLITNAILYNKQEGQVCITIQELNERLHITVKDTGIGIQKEEQERIFERFYRVDKGRSRKLGGTGLGLSIVKHITAFNNGTIRVESEPEVGTTFYIELPIRQFVNEDKSL